MITLGICLIYYGLALFLFQINGWLTEGRWTPFPVRRAWETSFGSPHIESPLLRPIFDWFLSWPLSVTLALVGCLFLALVYATRHIRGLRREHLRRRWMVEQATAAGYQAWAMPKVMGAFDQRLRSEKKADRTAR